MSIDNFTDVLAVLENSNGACLYWQMPDVARGEAAAAAGAVRMVDDLLVHPRAVEIEHGMAYTMPADPHAICRKWVARFGCGFHPDTRGKDYSPALSAEEIAEYDSDMESLFAVAADPYECGVMAMADAGLIPDDRKLVD